MFLRAFAPVWWDRACLCTMRRELVRGYVGVLRKWRFSMTGKVRNHCCLAMFSIVWAMRSKNCLSNLRNSESPNRANRVRSSKDRDCLEPSEKGARPNGSRGRRDREIFRETEVCSAAAPQIPAHLVEIRRNHAADDLGLYPILGLAICLGICPSSLSARIGPPAR